MKFNKIIVVLLVMFFCVGFLAPPASALMYNPKNPPVNEKVDPDGDPWGEQDSIGNTGGDLKSIQSDTEQNYFEIFIEFSKIYIKSIFIHKIDNNIKVIHKQITPYEIRQYANPEESMSATSGR